MTREYIASANTVDEAIDIACRELGITPDEISSREVLQLPKKGLFGKIKQQAKVKVVVDDGMDAIPVPPAPSAPAFARPAAPAAPAAPKAAEKKDRKPAPAQQAPVVAQPEPPKAAAPVKEAPAPAAPAAPQPAEPPAEAPMPAAPAEPTPEELEDIQPKIEIARAYLSEIFEKMGAGEVSMEFVCGPERTVEIRLGGDSIGAVIGKRGETLDSLQYLVCLVANRLRRREGDYVRFTMNAGNYREKREETLKALAARMAKKALKTGRPVALEPMNPYERRIIHAVITDIEGVTSKSTGEEPNRKVIIKPTREAPERRPRREGGRYRRDRGRRDSRERSESYERPERAPEEKEAPKEHREAVKLDDSVKLYGKIEL